MSSGLYMNVPLCNIERLGSQQKTDNIVGVFLSREPEVRVKVFILLGVPIHRIFGQVDTC